MSRPTYNYPFNDHPITLGSAELRVVAAAIIGYDGNAYSLPPPARHHTVIAHMHYELGHPRPISGVQGFMLSDGRFARRESARIVAERAKQLLARASKGDELYSEDVW
jgi:hypothetical protein